MKSFPRARFGAAVAVALLCGLIFASRFDLTRFGWAQPRVTSSAAAQVPAPAVASLVETQNAFEAIVDRVKPAVVSIHVTRFAREASNTNPTNPANPQRGNGNRNRQSRPQNIPPGL